MKNFLYIFFLYLFFAQNALSLEISSPIATYDFKSDSDDYTYTLGSRIGIDSNKTQQIFIEAKVTHVSQGSGSSSKSHQDFHLGGGINFRYSSYSKNIRPYLGSGFNYLHLESGNQMKYYAKLGLRFTLSRTFFFYLENFLFNHTIYAVDKEGNDLSEDKTFGIVMFAPHIPIIGLGMKV